MYNFPFAVGINFYHKQRFVEDGELEGMMEIARQQGLGHWMDSGLKVHVVNHTGCTYPPVEQNLLELFEQYWRLDAVTCHNSFSEIEVNAFIAWHWDM